MSPPKVDFFPNLKYFLISCDPESYLVQELARQRVYQVYYTKYQASSYLWPIKPILHCKIPKYYD